MQPCFYRSKNKINCIFFFQTTLAHIIANSAGRSNKARFVKLSATTSGINDVKEVVKVAKNDQQLFKCKTILFVDEIHRFNKLQQVQYTVCVMNIFK